MCLQRKKIYTNAHRILQTNNAPYSLAIPCGECTECRQDQMNEWELRTYYQFLDCIEHEGYCLWDTLTYKPEELPFLNKIEKNVPDYLNFKCFNREDIQAFFKRLRANLENRNIEVKNKIKFLVAAEYGQDESYTLRPHYHMIMFVNCDIAPVEMSMEIKKAWKKGKTAGIEDKGADYFNTKGLITEKANALRVAHYMGKYCMKQLQFDKVAEAKVKQLTKYWYELENGESNLTEKEIFAKPEWRKKKQDTLKKVKTFHLQSKGYGKYAMQCNCTNDSGTLMGMPSPKQVYWWQKMPMYFVRKYYYDYKREGKKVIWYLNETGKAWKLKNIQNTIKGFAKKLQETEEFTQTTEFKSWITEYFYKQYGIPDDSRWAELNDLLFAYRNGRTWKEYAEYIIYHKGRIYSGGRFDPKYTIIYNADSALYATYKAKDNELYFNYCHRNDMDYFKKQIISLYDLGDSERGYIKPNGREMKAKQFAEMYCINENTWEGWNDFDKLSDVLDTINFYIENMKAAHQNIKEKHDKLKTAGLYKL